MGKIAQPNTPYCGGFTQGAISAGGQIFTTQNPPISYTLSGKTATISDATGVIGSVDLSDNLTAETTTSASEGVDYCAGKIKAVLRWSNGSVSTLAPPIRYTKTFTGLALYRLIHSAYGGTQIREREVVSASGSFAVSRNGCLTSDPAILAACQYCQNTFGLGINYITTDGGIGRNLAGEAQILNCNNDSGVFTSIVKLQDLSSRYQVTVTDSTGQIFSRQYNTEPTDFQVTCYDYDITEVKYVCEGACPSAEFECRCEESNTLMCYDWDPNNPDIFKPLFTTSITSG